MGAKTVSGATFISRPNDYEKKNQLKAYFNDAHTLIACVTYENDISELPSKQEKIYKIPSSKLKIVSRCVYINGFFLSFNLSSRHVIYFLITSLSKPSFIILTCYTLVTHHYH